MGETQRTTAFQRHSDLWAVGGLRLQIGLWLGFRLLRRDSESCEKKWQYEAGDTKKPKHQASSETGVPAAAVVIILMAIGNATSGFAAVHFRAKKLNQEQSEVPKRRSKDDGRGGNG
jgi:hypothetical protein